MSLLTVLLFGVGALLIYGAVKNKNPLEVVKGALTRG
jgi:uncharacterized membrane protein